MASWVCCGNGLGAKGNHKWLKAISDSLSKQQMEDLFDGASSFTRKIDQELVDSVLWVSIEANRRMVEELRGKYDMEALLEFMKPEIDKIVEEEGQKREDRGKIIGAAETLRRLGHGDAEIADFIAKQFHLKEDEVYGYLKGEGYGKCI